MLEWLRRIKKEHATLSFATVSETGLVRSENQDHFFASAEKALFCVADGMGGCDGGEVASDFVCKEIERAAHSSRDFHTLVANSADAIRAANDKIRAYAATRGWRQMGSTIAALFLDTAGDIGVACHVGDSRIYRLRDGVLEQLTDDHTVAGEISRRSKTLTGEVMKRLGALSHILTRAVGIEKNVSPDWRKLDLRPGDVYMLCSDGIYDMATDDTIREILVSSASPRQAMDALSKTVVDAGAADNYTCIIIKYG